VSSSYLATNHCYYHFSTNSAIDVQLDHTLLRFQTPEILLALYPRQAAINVYPQISAHVPRMLPAIVPYIHRPQQGQRLCAILWSCSSHRALMQAHSCRLHNCRLRNRQVRNPAIVPAMCPGGALLPTGAPVNGPFFELPEDRLELLIDASFFCAAL